MSEAAPDGKQNPPTSAHTILVVDDDAALCRFICLLLTQYGYTALHALNADDAHQVSNRHSGEINLLLVDIAMAGTSGPQLAQELQSTRPNLRLLFMSGLVTEKNFQGVLGGSFIHKPFSPSALVDKIQSVLTGKSLHA